MFHDGCFVNTGLSLNAYTDYNWLFTFWCVLVLSGKDGYYYFLKKKLRRERERKKIGDYKGVAVSLQAV